MSGAGSGAPDLLESGGPDRPRRFSADCSPLAGTRAAELARRHRRLVAGGVVVVALAGWGAYRWYDERQPQVPDIRVSGDRSAESVPLWSANADGRPGSPLTLSVSARLAVPDLRQGDPRVTAVGLSGPGLSRPGVFPHYQITGRPEEFDLTGQVDCDLVTLPVDPNAYTVQVRATEGPRASLATVPLTASRVAVNERVTTGCSTWLAARDLTVTAVRAAVDPVEPHLDLALQVANAGHRAALVWLGDTTATGVRVSLTPRTVPALGTVTVNASVDLDRCWSWDQVSRPVTAAETPVPLVGAVGVREPLDTAFVGQGAVTNGVVLLPAVAEQLEDAFVQACGGVRVPVMLTADGSSSYDASTRVLTARALVDLPPGLVRSVRFVPTRYDSRGLTPLFGTSPWLTPDDSGQAGWPVRFSVPPDVPCPGGGPSLVMDVEVLVPQPGRADRGVRFELAAETVLPETQVAAACTPGG